MVSKNIIPAIRKENRDEKKSPVYRHIGLYGYRYSALADFLSLPIGHYESLESLEQLRFLENGYTIQVADVDYGNLPQMTGVDTAEDLERARKLVSEL